MREASQIVSLLNIPSLDFWTTCQQNFPNEHDWLVSLVRAFRSGSADFIIIDDRRMRSQIEGAVFACAIGLLVEGSGYCDEQYTARHFRLTELGRHVLLDIKAHDTYAQ